jgi:hypothetical protein
MSDITVLLPELQDKTALSPHDLIIWEQFMQRLLEHEHDHVRIITDPFYRDEAVRKFSAIKQLTIFYDRQADPNALIKDSVEAETARIGHDLVLTIKQQNDE